MKSIDTLKDRPWSDLDILEGMTTLDLRWKPF